jgi:hypothetical protein
LSNRTVDQPFKYLGTWLVDQWSKVGLHVTQRARHDRRRLRRHRQSAADVSKDLPHSANPEDYGNFDDPDEVALYDRMLREPDPGKQRVLMLWWYRIVPYRSYVKGWHISPSHFLGNDLVRGMPNEASPVRDWWCPGAESNHRHCDFQSHALPTELPGHPPRLEAGPQPIAHAIRPIKQARPVGRAARRWGRPVQRGRCTAR